MSEQKESRHVLATLLAIQLQEQRAIMLDAVALASLAHSLRMTAGQVLMALMEAHGIKAEEVAKRIGIDPMQVSRLRRSKLAVSQRNAALLGRFFGTGARFWLDLQAADDEALIEADATLQAELDRIVPIVAPNHHDRDRAAP